MYYKDPLNCFGVNSVPLTGKRILVCLLSTCILKFEIAIMWKVYCLVLKINILLKQDVPLSFVLYFVRRKSCSLYLVTVNARKV